MRSLTPESRFHTDFIQRSCGLTLAFLIGAAPVFAQDGGQSLDQAASPFGAKLSKLVRFGNTPVQFVASYEHDFYDEGFGPSDTVSFTVKLLLPKG